MDFLHDLADVGSTFNDSWVQARQVLDSLDTGFPPPWAPRIFNYGKILIYELCNILHFRST